MEVVDAQKNTPEHLVLLDQMAQVGAAVGPARRT